MSSLPSIPASFAKGRSNDFWMALLEISTFAVLYLYLPAEWKWKPWLLTPIALDATLHTLHLLPAFSALKLTEDGFSFRRTLLRKRFRWEELGGFGIFEDPKGEEYVGFNFADESRGKRKSGGALSTYDGRLFDHYGHDPVDLARMLSLCHAHFAPDEHRRVALAS